MMSNPFTMERASKLIQKLRLPGDTITAGEIACAAWAGAVGKKIAVRTRASRLVATRLVIEVEDRVWQRQLMALSPHILRNLDRSLGPGMVDDLEFRVVPRRKEAHRAVAAASDPEAIADPVLRSIYLASKKRGMA